MIPNAEPDDGARKNAEHLPADEVALERGRIFCDFPNDKRQQQQPGTPRCLRGVQHAAHALGEFTRFTAVKRPRPTGAKSNDIAEPLMSVTGIGV